MQRRNQQAALQDDFTYQYEADKNRLASVSDAVPPETITYDTKVYDSGPIQSDGKVYRQITVEGSAEVPAGQSALLQANELIHLKQNFHAKAGSGFHAKWTDAPNTETTEDDNSNFQYDAIGNLIADSGEGTNISWTPYGKVRRVTHDDGTVVDYRYDATGNRVEKQVIGNDSTLTTRYIRDASGNVLAIYENDQLSEQPIYGSSRLGVYKGGAIAGEQKLGLRNYELNSHLGTVHSVITDNVNLTSDSAWATIVSTQDVFPFGLEMSGRSWSSDNYAFGFQGQLENKKSNTVHFKFREHDSKYDRFWSVDPLFASYPWNSTYAFSENRVIDGVELEGAERLSVHTPGWAFSSETILRNSTATEVQMNSATAGVVLRHPIATSNVGSVQFGGTNISTVSGRIARHVAENGNMSVDIGSQRNAFRHALWSATITNEYDESIALRIGNAHEGIPMVAQGNAHVDFSVPAPTNIDAADNVVDFLNNEVGRGITGQLGKDATQIDIAKEVLKVQRNQGLWTATETEGGVSISRTRITEEQFNRGMEMLNTLDDNGMNEADRNRLENE